MLSEETMQDIIRLLQVRSKSLISMAFLLTSLQLPAGLAQLLSVMPS